MNFIGEQTAQALSQLNFDRAADVDTETEDDK